MNSNWTGLAYTKVDHTVDFNWGAGSPAGLPGDFSIRWTGKVQPQYSETYTFCLDYANNDVERLWINGQKIIDQTYWEAGGTCGDITLAAGVKYSLTLEYGDGLNNAAIHLSWRSPSVPQQTVPYDRLFPESPAPTPTGTPSNGTGLTGQYYTYGNFTNLAYTQTDPVVNFNWGMGGPAGLPADGFSIRWSGYVQPRFSETYTFCSVKNNMARLWINGQKIIDNDYYDTVEVCGAIALTAGVKYPITLEYAEGENAATVNLTWSSPTLYKEIIPASQLFPGSPTPTPTISLTPTKTPTSTLTPTPTSTPTLTMPSGQVWKYYYYAGGQPVAVRVTGSQNPQENGLFYTLGDQLGSTSVVTDSNGNKVSEMRYSPWGEDRYSSGNLPTDRKYTGQREDAGIGLYYYNARWYDAKLGRFAQADTVIPNKILPIFFDRYAYVNNRPTNDVDPSGHCFLLCIVLPVVAVVAFVVIVYEIVTPPEKREQAVKDVVALAMDAPAIIASTYQTVLNAAQKEEEKSPLYWLWMAGTQYMTSQLKAKLGENETQGEGEVVTAPPDVQNVLKDPSKSPGNDWTWHGKGKPGSKGGRWVNDKTGESIWNDLDHSEEKYGPHLDYWDKTGKGWRVFPDGHMEPR